MLWGGTCISSRKIIFTLLWANSSFIKMAYVHTQLMNYRHIQTYDSVVFNLWAKSREIPHSCFLIFNFLVISVYHLFFNLNLHGTCSHMFGMIKILKSCYVRISKSWSKIFKAIYLDLLNIFKIIQIILSWLVVLIRTIYYCNLYRHKMVKLSTILYSSSMYFFCNFSCF